MRRATWTLFWGERHFVRLRCVQLSNRSGGGASNGVCTGAPADYLYTCGTNHSAGETAHWPFFQA